MQKNGSFWSQGTWKFALPVANPCDQQVLYPKSFFVAPNPRKHCGTRKVQQSMCRGISCPCTPHTVAVVQNTCLHIKTKNRIASEVTLLRPIIRNSGSIETRKGGQTKEMMESRYFPKVVIESTVSECSCGQQQLFILSQHVVKQGARSCHPACLKRFSWKDQ